MTRTTKAHVRIDGVEVIRRLPRSAAWSDDDDPQLRFDGVSVRSVVLDPALFRVFVEIPVGDRSRYLDFANSEGVLFFGGETPTDTKANGGRLSQWKREHVELIAAVKLYEALIEAQCDLDALGIVLEDALNSHGHPLAGIRAAIMQRDGMLITAPVTEDATSREVVQGVLARLVEDALRRSGVTIGLTSDRAPFGSGLRLAIRPENLSGAMWLQLALAVDGDRRYEPCPICGRWWDATGARSHKTVCSDKCRAKRAYQRRKEAKGAATR